MNEDTNRPSNIIDYPLDKKGKIVTRRNGLTRMKPRLEAPPASQPGSVDWSMTHLFGSTDSALEMIESLVAGQGENADEKWVRFVLLYRQWEQQHQSGELENPPTLNQVCHALNFDARDFIRDIQTGIQGMMAGLVHTQAAMASTKVMKAILMRAVSVDGTKDSELALKIAGVIDSGGGVNVQINNTNQNAVLLKSEKDKLKSPLLQFKETVDAIDEEVRSNDESD